MAQISQSLTFVINRIARDQLQEFYLKMLMNESIERVVGIPLDGFHLFHTFLYFVLNYAKQHNLLHVVVEAVPFTNFIDVNSINIEVPYLSSVKMYGKCFFNFSFNFSCMFDSWVFNLVSTKCA